MKHSKPLQAVRQGAVKTLVQRVTDDQKAFAQKGSKVVNGDTINGSANVEEAPECSPLTVIDQPSSRKLNTLKALHAR
jgi:hypothetical protein